MWTADYLWTRPKKVDHRLRARSYGVFSRVACTQTMINPDPRS